MSEADTESSDGSSGPASRRLQPLRSLLTKKHSSKMSGSAKRWFEIDDNLGVLYQFLGREELEKRRACPAAHKAHTPSLAHAPAPHGCTRLHRPNRPKHDVRPSTDFKPHAGYPFCVCLSLAEPHRVFGLGDLSNIMEVGSPEGQGKIMFTFRLDEKHRNTLTPSQLVCSTDTRRTMHLWINGVQARLLRQQEAGAPISRTVWIEIPKNTSPMRSEGGQQQQQQEQEEAGAAAATTEEEEGVSASEDEAEEGAEKDDLGSPFRADRLWGDTGLGIRMRNVPWSAIGSVIDAVQEGGPAAEAGLRVGDVIVAVGGKACYSHMHTSRLLGASSNPLELLVWQPSYRPFDSPNSTYYDSGVEVVSVF